MFGRKKRQQGGEPTVRDRMGSAMFYVLGPAAVEGALQGHSPEARAAWKSLVENNKRARAEAKRQDEIDRDR
jgi:hypothetical protein